MADTEIIKKAPFRLTASGVSDLLGKYTALADWKIAHILTGEYICDTICAMEYKALDAMMGSYAELGNGDTKAYEDLMYGLLLSGLAMKNAGVRVYYQLVPEQKVIEIDDALKKAKENFGL